MASLNESTFENILEFKTFAGVRIWHILSFLCSILLFVVVLICCCINFRIPRTKQEIEADYIRKNISRKFRKQLDLFADCNMDGMDLLKAIEQVRKEMMSQADQVLVVDMNNLIRNQSPRQSTITANQEISENMEDRNSMHSTHFPSTIDDISTCASTIGNGTNTKLTTIVSAFKKTKKIMSSKADTIDSAI